MTSLRPGHWRVNIVDALVGRIPATWSPRATPSRLQIARQVPSRSKTLPSLRRWGEEIRFAYEMVDSQLTKKVLARQLSNADTRWKASRLWLEKPSYIRAQIASASPFLPMSLGAHPQARSVLPLVLSIKWSTAIPSCSRNG